MQLVVPRSHPKLALFCTSEASFLWYVGKQFWFRRFTKHMSARNIFWEFSMYLTQTRLCSYFQYRRVCFFFGFFCRLTQPPPSTLPSLAAGSESHCCPFICVPQASKLRSAHPLLYSQVVITKNATTIISQTYWHCSLLLGASQPPLGSFFFWWKIAGENYDATHNDYPGRLPLHYVNRINTREVHELAVFGPKNMVFVIHLEWFERLLIFPTCAMNLTP